MLPNIEPVITKIVEGYQPEKILIFGSYAAGNAGPDSDLDILIVKETTERPVMRRRQVLELLSGLRVPKDIFVITRIEFEEAKDLVGTIAYEASHFGRVVYG